MYAALDVRIRAVAPHRGNANPHSSQHGQVTGSEAASVFLCVGSFVLPVVVDWIATVPETLEIASIVVVAVHSRSYQFGKQ